VFALYKLILTKISYIGNFLKFGLYRIPFYSWFSFDRFHSSFFAERYIQPFRQWCPLVGRDI